jgi:transposase
LAVCVRTKAVLAADTAGSRTADVKRMEPILAKLAGGGFSVEVMVADKGYDAEYVHTLVKKHLNAEAIIPARGSKQGSRTRGVNRNRMKRELKEGTDMKEKYNLRAIVETVNSMIKRVLGEVLTGRKEETRHAEAMFKCIAHNFRVGLEMSSSGLLV